jgi:molybdenum cofactor guanylyltransferase
VKLALIVNAGGKSRRMGQDKALLRLPAHTGGKTLLAHIIQRMQPCIDGETLLVANRADLAAQAGLFSGSVHVTADRWPDAGALGGLATGLSLLLERGNCAWSLCVACDMPFVSPKIMMLLARKVRAAREIQAVVPVVEGQVQPFHALYHVDLAQHLRRALSSGNLRIADALSGARVLLVEDASIWRELDLAPDECRRAFWNVNTPAEWQQAQIWLAEDA